MPKEVVIDFDQRVVHEGLLIRIDVTHPGVHGRLPGTIPLEFLHLGSNQKPEPLVLDGYLFGVLLFAMGGATHVRVNGPLSTKAIRNACTLAEAWHCWDPETYSPLEVLSEKIYTETELLELRRGLPNKGKAIAAYSGGLDSTFTAMRHASRQLGPASHHLRDLVMVHGFDVSLNKPQHFEELLARTAPFVQNLGAQLHVVRTNIKDVLAHNWEQVFASQLACVLHQFSDEFDYGLIASGAILTDPDVAWGSSPQTDYLLSGGLMDIIHDGAAFSRTEKAALVAKNRIAIKSVKVCWQGAEQGRNCGVCEKCVRTRLNFLAAGIQEPECFDTPFNVDMVDTLRVTNIQQLNLLKKLANEGLATDPESEWAIRLNQRILWLERESQDHVEPILHKSSDDLASRMHAQQAMMAEFFNRFEPLWLLTGMPGNIGDHLIWAGTERFLTKAGLAYSPCNIERLREHIQAGKGQPPDPICLVIPGSAACTTYWHEWLPDLVISASPRFKHIVILPSEFEPKVPIVETMLSLENVYPFAREPVSYGHIKRFSKGTLALDLALWAMDLVPVNSQPKRPDQKQLLALRTDAGSVLGLQGLQPSSANNDISLSCSDLDSFLARISQAEEIITDRLHVTVAALLLGKQTYYVDPYNHKISRYMKYHFGDGSPEGCARKDEVWLLQQGHVTHKEASR